MSLAGIDEKGLGSVHSSEGEKPTQTQGSPFALNSLVTVGGSAAGRGAPPEGACGGDPRAPPLQEPGRLPAPWLLRSPAHDSCLLIRVPLSTESPSEASVVLPKLESFELCGEPTLNGLQ